MPKIEIEVSEDQLEALRHTADLMMYGRSNMNVPFRDWVLFVAQLKHNEFCIEYDSNEFHKSKDCKFFDFPRWNEM